MAASGPLAYSYIRFSSPDQLKGDSLRRQLELSERYARENGLVLDESLSFRDLGVSAFDKSNIGPGGKLREFLDAIRDGRVLPGSYLLVESLDRLSRAQILDALTLFLQILQSKITIVTLSDGMSYTADSQDSNRTFHQLIVSLAIMSRAHEESLTKSRRLKEAWNAKRNAIGIRKLTRQCPAWLRLSVDRSRYEEIPENVAVVRKIIDMVRSGLGKGSIAKRLNKAGIPSFGGRSKDGTWFESYVTKIIRNPDSGNCPLR